MLFGRLSFSISRWNFRRFSLGCLSCEIERLQLVIWRWSRAAVGYVWRLNAANLVHGFWPFTIPRPNRSWILRFFGCRENQFTRGIVGKDPAVNCCGCWWSYCDVILFTKGICCFVTFSLTGKAVHGWPTTSNDHVIVSSNCNDIGLRATRNSKKNGHSCE